MLSRHLKLVISNIFLYSVMILVVACGRASPSAPEASNAASQLAKSHDYTLCGSTTAKRRIEEYFEQLGVFSLRVTEASCEVSLPKTSSS